jgi:hypothetical protein
MSLRLQRKCEKYALGKHIMGYTAVTTAIYCRLGSALNVIRLEHMTPLVVQPPTLFCLEPPLTLPSMIFIVRALTRLH